MFEKHLRSVHLRAYEAYHVNDALFEQLVRATDPPSSRSSDLGETLIPKIAKFGSRPGTIQGTYRFMGPRSPSPDPPSLPAPGTRRSTRKVTSTTQVTPLVVDPVTSPPLAGSSGVPPRPATPPFSHTALTLRIPARPRSPPLPQTPPPLSAAQERTSAPQTLNKILAHDRKQAAKARAHNEAESGVKGKAKGKGKSHGSAGPQQPHVLPRVGGSSCVRAPRPPPPRRSPSPAEVPRITHLPEPSPSVHPPTSADQPDPVVGGPRQGSPGVDSAAYAQVHSHIARGRTSIPALVDLAYGNPSRLTVRSPSRWEELVRA